MDVLRDDLKNLKIPIVLILIYSIFMQVVFGTICPVKALTGIPCPACGLTHATIYLFTGQINRAFQSNATVLLWWISIVLFGIDRYIYKLKIKIFPICFIITGIITIFLYFCNMIGM